MTTLQDLEVRPGPQTNADGVPQAFLRGGRTGENIFGMVHAQHYEACVRGKVFSACNQAVVTAGTALTATGVTFHLWNPPGSGFNAVILQTRITLVINSTPGSIVYAANDVSLTAVSAGTPLAVKSTNLSGGSGVVLAKSATTLPSAPYAIAPLVTGETAAGIVSLIDYVDGAIIVPPGAQLSLQGITIVASFLAGMIWEEVPI